MKRLAQNSGASLQGNSLSPLLQVSEHLQRQGRWEDSEGQRVCPLPSHKSSLESGSQAVPMTVAAQGLEAPAAFEGPDVVTGPGGRLARSWVEKDRNSPCVLPFMMVGTRMPLAVTPEWRWMAIKRAGEVSDSSPPIPRVPSFLLLACPALSPSPTQRGCFIFSVPKALEMFVIKMWAFLCPGNSAASKERELVKRQHNCVFLEPMSKVLVGLGGGTACAGFFAGAGVWLVSDRSGNQVRNITARWGPGDHAFIF